MCDALYGRDRNQPPPLIYARLRAMDALAFEELVLESFERRGHRVVRNRRYTGDGGIDGQVVIDGRVVELKKYAKPNTTAQIFWLKNRKSEWNDKQEMDVNVRTVIVDDITDED